MKFRESKNLDGYVDLSVSELNSLGFSPRQIDVREPDEFDGDLGHLAQAELVPLGTLGEAALSWDRESPLVMICRSGRRSARAAEMLVRLGFSNVANLTGGMIAVRNRP